MKDFVIVEANITLKTTEAGGRQGGILPGYRPNHFFTHEGSFIGDIQWEDKKMINPGESRVVTVRFLDNPEIRKHMSVGTAWLINEGSRNVGIGVILRVNPAEK